MDQKYVGSAWRSRFLRAPKIAFVLENRSDFTRLDCLAKVRLGLKTGYDKFFFLSKVETVSVPRSSEVVQVAKGLCYVKGLDGIWKGVLSLRDLLPAILNPHQLFDLDRRLFVIPHNTSWFYLHPRKGPPKEGLTDYIRAGEREEVNQKQLVKQNADSERWYRQVRDISTSAWVLPYNSGYDYGAWDNRAGAVLNGRFVGAEAREEIDAELLGATLNSTFTIVTRLTEGTPTGVEGAFDVGPPAARRMFVPDIRQIPENKTSLVTDVLQEWRKVNTMPPAPSREARIHPLRHELDLAILEALGLSRGEASALVGRVYESYARWRSAVEDTEAMMRENRREMHRNLSTRSIKPSEMAAERVWEEMMLDLKVIPSSLLSKEDELQYLDVPRTLDLRSQQPRLQPGMIVLRDGSEIDLGSFDRVRYLSMLLEIGFEPPFNVPCDSYKAGAIVAAFKRIRDNLKQEAARRALGYVSEKDIEEVIKGVEKRWFRRCREGGDEGGDVVR